MSKPVMHLKRPFNPAAPHTKVTYCGENLGSVQRYALSDGRDITCKRCLKALGRKA